MHDSLGLRRLLAACGLVAVVACQKDLAPVPAAVVAFAKTADSVLLGDTYQLNVQVRDGSGNVLTGRKVTYSSDQPAVAEPDANGLVTTKAVNTATMRAVVESREGSMPLRVLTRASRVVVAPAAIEIPVSTQRTLVATVANAAGDAIAGRVITWRSSNLAVASVNAAGLVTPVALGTATISATVDLDGVTGSSAVVVTDPVTTVRITPGIPQILRLGRTVQLAAQALNSAQQVLSRPVSWSSVNAAVATVSDNGLVSAVGLGTTSVVAESESRQATITVTVVPVPVATVQLSPSDTVNLFVQGTGQQFSFVVRDSANNVLTLTGRTVAWSSDNLPVVTVSGGGVATGLSVGAAKVFVTVDQVRSNETPVKVRLVPVATVTVSPTGVSLRVSFALQMNAQLRDEKGAILTNRPVAWSSSNDAVATVSPAGVVTGVAPGTVTITATAEGISSSATVNIVP